MIKNLPLSCKPLCLFFLLIAFNTFAQPKVTSFSPATGLACVMFTITGAGFNGNFVHFGAVKATVTSASTMVDKVLL